MKPIINLILLGKGNVGNAWLDLFIEQQVRYASFADVRLVAVANSARYLLNSEGLNLESINNFQQHSVAGNLVQLIEKVEEYDLTHVVVLDITASKDVTDAYSTFAELGWNIISANKRAMTLPSERYNFLVNKLKENKCYWGINATVGAALPIQSSMQDLLQCGDTLLSVSGVFSGSLSYLLTEYDGQQSFTDLVKKACEAGITEPDPRDDLSGTDVQRKLLILSRIAGHLINLSDIKVSPLLPESLLTGDLNQFWSNKNEIDNFMANAYEQAQQQNERLVYLAQTRIIHNVVEGKVGLQALPASDAVSQLSPTDNVFTLTTDFYSNNPLIIRGPGAGAEITATAVNIDLNKYVTQLAVAMEVDK